MNGTSVEISQQMMTRCLFCRDVVVFTNFCDWPSVDPDLPTAPYDYRNIFRLLSNVNFCGVVGNKNTAGPIKRPRSSTNTLLHSITVAVASCYNLQVPQTFNLSATTKLRGFIHDYNASFQRSSILPSNISINCRPWRHQLVMVLWLNSQQNRFFSTQAIAWGQCKQAREATYRCQRLKAIYMCQLLTIFT